MVHTAFAVAPALVFGPVVHRLAGVMGNVGAPVGDDLFRQARAVGEVHALGAFLLEKLDRDGTLPGKYPYPVQVWQLGSELTWIFLGGEVVVDYSLRFKEAYGWNDTWVAGYSNDVFAYIPSERVLHEGGYEGGGAMIPYGQPRPFAAGVEEAIANKVDELVKRTDGVIP